MTQAQRIAAWSLAAIAVIILFLMGRNGGQTFVSSGGELTPATSGPFSIAMPALAPISIMRGQLPEFSRPDFDMKARDFGGAKKDDCGCKPTCGCSKTGQYLSRPPSNIGNILENMIASLPAPRPCLFPRTDWEAFYNAPGNGDLRGAFRTLSEVNKNWILRQGYSLTPGDYARFMYETDANFKADVSRGSRPEPSSFRTC